MSPRKNAKSLRPYIDSDPGDPVVPLRQKASFCIATVTILRGHDTGNNGTEVIRLFGSSVNDGSTSPPAKKGLLAVPVDPPLSAAPRQLFSGGWGPDLPN